MSMRMLIDARHPEETRVAVAKGNRIEEFDFESAEHKQLKGNIYLAKVTRVVPSLQAAFVDYGGNRHGFLAFSEIHPDYYQIPLADRQALLREQEEAEHDDDDNGDHNGHNGHNGNGRSGREERAAAPEADAEADDESGAFGRQAGSWHPRLRQARYALKLALLRRIDADETEQQRVADILLRAAAEIEAKPAAGPAPQGAPA